MVEDTALSALLGLWQNKGLANSIPSPLSTRGILRCSLTTWDPPVLQCSSPLVHGGQLGGAGPPGPHTAGRQKQPPPWEEFGFHCWGGFISGNQEFLSTWCQKELCLFSHHWSLSCGSGGRGPRPSLVLGDVGAPCGLRCSFLASWLCHPESEWQAGRGDMHSVLNQGNLRIHLSQVWKGFAFAWYLGSLCINKCYNKSRCNLPVCWNRPGRASLEAFGQQFELVTSNSGWWLVFKGRP